MLAQPRITIELLLWTGVATLVALGALAGYRAGLRGWPWLMAAAGGGAGSKARK